MGGTPPNRPTKNNLGRIRRICRLSQPDVGYLMGRYTGEPIDFTTVAKHESGLRHPTPEQMEAYSRIYKVPSNILFLPATSDAHLKQIIIESNPQWDWSDELIPHLSSGTEQE